MNVSFVARPVKNAGLAFAVALLALSALAGPAAAAPDRTAPTVSITSPVSGTTWGTSSGNIVFTASDNVAVTATSCNVDGGAYRSCTSNSTGSAINLPNGSHTVCVEARDAAGNVGRDCNTWTVDGVVVTITSPTPKQVIRSRTVTVAFSVADSPTSAAYGNTSFATQCKLDAGAFVACVSPHTFSNVAVGAHTITVRAQGDAGPTGIKSVSFSVK